MSRIQSAFENLKAGNRAAFMPFLTAGDPDLETTKRLILAMAEAGADLVEVGMPFSDSIADGPTIQRANERALAAGATIAGVLDVVRSVREHCEIPMLLMGSYNPVYMYGTEAFCRDAADGGADGLIIADLLPDDSKELRAPARASGLDTVFLAAPTSTDARLELVTRESTGFLYAVSLTGVTGERNALPPDLADFVRKIKSFTTLPVCVGFGISTPEMAREVARIADGVIIGSAIVKRIHTAAEAGTDPCPAVADFVRDIAKALSP